MWYYFDLDVPTHGSVPDTWKGGGGEAGGCIFKNCLGVRQLSVLPMTMQVTTGIEVTSIVCGALNDTKIKYNIINITFFCWCPIRVRIRGVMLPNSLSSLATWGFLHTTYVMQNYES
jgi:hypothetical protein